MLKLDELLTKKKDALQILDLSKSTANNKDELKRLLEKVPEYKIRPEKVKREDIQIKDKKFIFRVTKKELRKPRFPFANPIPSEMRSLNLEDLCSVDIPWKMLTSLKPKTKIDEEYFSRVIDLGKLSLSTRKEEQIESKTKQWTKKIRNRNGVTEMRSVTCSECAEEFCSTEECKNFVYDTYERVNNLIRTSSELKSQQQNTVNNTDETKKPKKKLVKKKKKVKKKLPAATASTSNRSCGNTKQPKVTNVKKIQNMEKSKLIADKAENQTTQKKSKVIKRKKQSE